MSLEHERFSILLKMLQTLFALKARRESGGADLMAQNKNSVLELAQIKWALWGQNSGLLRQAAEANAQVADRRAWSFLRPDPRSAPECRQIFVVVAFRQTVLFNSFGTLAKHHRGNPYGYFIQSLGNDLRERVESFKR
jgi:hypothetical protein